MRSGRAIGESMPEKTPLYTEHMAQKATMVDFYGWSMPLHYGSQVQEHHAVRQNVGLFDVSHMHVIDVQDDQAITWLRHLLANDVAKLVDHQAQYSLMLNEYNGVFSCIEASNLEISSVRHYIHVICCNSICKTLFYYFSALSFRLTRCLYYCASHMR